MKYLSSEVGKFNCPVHGKVARKVFVVPETNEGGVAHYDCFHCWHADGEPDTKPRAEVERAYSIRGSQLASNPAVQQVHYLNGGN